MRNTEQAVEHDQSSQPLNLKWYLSGLVGRRLCQYHNKKLEITLIQQVEGVFLGSII